MAASRLGIAWSIGLLCLPRLSAAAAPTVDISVRTAFDAPPFLLELLETAAEENATSYFPLLDKIAAGHFDKSTTDKELYASFRTVLKDDGHITRDEDLSSFDFALSLHTTAPRIAAHFQYYDTSIEPALGEDKTKSCHNWIHVPFTGQRYCTASLAESDAKAATNLEHSAGSLPLDRILGPQDSSSPSILYADLTSTSWRELHKTTSRTARDGKTSYRIRYRPAKEYNPEKLTVSGYGVELALKRTDYIVIDDREAGEQETANTNAQTNSLDEEEVADLRPLSTSELSTLGHKASVFVLESKDPFDTLLKLTQDFPKHSSAIAAGGTSSEFTKEHMVNRQIVLPAGYNLFWINGVQIMARDVNAYSLLEHLRRERKLINSVQELGLSPSQAVELLSHDAIVNAQSGSDVQRYDWRDYLEGGNVIIWLNNLEKDKRYAAWPTTNKALLQRMYPGQLPPVAREVHNFVALIDFSSYADILEVVESMQNIVKRLVPIRIGLVPVVTSEAAKEQAKVVYHLLQTYGLSAVLEYLELSVKINGRKHSVPHSPTFSKVIADRELRRNREAATLQEVMGATDSRITAATAYASRLGATTAPLMLVNGVAFDKTEDWLQVMSQRINLDLRFVQQHLYEQDQETIEDLYLPHLFLEKVSLRRNKLLVPEDDKTVRHVNVGELPFSELPGIPIGPEVVDDELVHLTIIGDLDSEETFELLIKIIDYKIDHDNIELKVLHNPSSSPVDGERSMLLSQLDPEDIFQALFDALAAALMQGFSGQASMPVWQTAFKELYKTRMPFDESLPYRWRQFQPILESAGISAGQRAFVLNGRVVGPFATEDSLNADDLDSLLAYERKMRLSPAAVAIKAMSLGDKAATPLAFAQVSNLIALSLVSDIPEGIFDSPPTARTSMYKKWSSEQTAFTIGDEESASIQIVVSLDPASETAQRWTPILHTLSELAGVSIKIFLNPQDRIQELPIKRFYRYVADAKPTFLDDGSQTALSARFSGLPADALLNIGMDIPPAWLVAPKDSVHDLDNIKLSAVKAGTDINAVYELEHILIEGHSRDATLGPAPRGAQLVLGTGTDAHFADTIIMANLGYFQFKANPGVYNLGLQKGRSEEIFTIDSAGTKGYSPQPGDGSTEIALMSFRGATLFPRLSRNPGKEEQDVLEASSSSTVEQLANQADKLLENAGLSGSPAGKYLSKAAQLGSQLLAGGQHAAASSGQAEVNIFSVASGHLYERMLNIMMVSVMKHTKHSVKFWFIEQFLSPSFKDFVPKLAEEYGFQYEMVTYKWPHWLRGQKEKQREIWGYKILFLDVLFPLDLDKVIFVDADQIVRTDMYDLVQLDLHGAPYGFTPMCDSRTEMEGFRFWKQGYWKKFLQGLPYHISALYVVDLKKFRQIAAGDRLRQQYHTLSADPGSLSNLDQDLPNHMQSMLPIYSLPQDWLWCETWCSDEALKTAKTIDLCNNPQTKEPKLERARRQVPEWTVYDDEIAAVAKRFKNTSAEGRPVAGDATDAGPQGEEESIQERLQREDAEKEKGNRPQHTRDEL